MNEIAVVVRSDQADALVASLRDADALIRICHLDDADVEKRLFGIRPDAAILYLAEGDQHNLRLLVRLAYRLRGLVIPSIAIVPPDSDCLLQSVLVQVDDYVRTPVTAEELFSRLRLVALRHSAAEVLVAGNLRLDPDRFRVTVDDVPLTLTHREFELLRFLLLHRGDAVTREAVLTHIWGSDYAGGPRAVDTQIRRLRSKLADRAPGLIETVTRVGYRIPPEAPPPARNGGNGLQYNR